jgi:hypothetical protein
MQGVVTFDNDQAYLDWVAAHPNGFVVNSYNPPRASYLKLHHTTCKSITTNTRGNWTKDYSKICASHRHELEQWAQDRFDTRLSRCGICMP